jgi:PPM family protein phosphatase
VGTVRSNNEDAVRLLPDAGQGIRLAVLADGMGGHACGEVASALAVEAVMAHMRTLDDQRLAPSQWLDALSQSVQAANLAIWQHAQTRPEATGMGTTLCVLSFAHGHAYWAWVGDSRVYLWQGGLLTLLTRDDTVVNRMLDDGTLTAEQAAHHPDSHVLSQALGTHEAVERVNVCGHPLKLTPGDRLVITSDGVHDLLPFEQWGLCLSGLAPHEAASALIDAGKAAGSADNLSAVVVDICPPRDATLVPAATRH